MPLAAPSLLAALAEISPTGPSRPATVLVLRLTLLGIMEREELLHPARATPTARKAYAKAHSVTSALPAWPALVRTFQGLHTGDAKLALRPLDSWLFSPVATQGLRPPSAGALTRCLAAVRAWLSHAAATPDAFALGTAYEGMLAHAQPRSKGVRKRSGSFYTPRPLVDHVLDVALNPLLRADATLPTVLDPACGCGNFLVAAAERLAGSSTRAQAAAQVHGIDLDPIAAELAAFSLWRFVAKPGAPWTPFRNRIRVADALASPTGTPLQFNVVVGNPPFLNQLELTTTHSRERARLLAEWSGGAVTGYADLSSAFLLLAARRCKPGGRVAMVMPQSLLATRDAAGVRDALRHLGRLRSLWLASRSLFSGATVLTCVPSFEIAPALPSDVTLHDHATFAPIGSAPMPPPQAPTWSALAARLRGVPDPGRLLTAGTLRDIASATADFRDQYYGLEGFLVEDADLSPARRESCPALITSGLIGCVVNHWGRTPTRVHKRVWIAPRVDRARMNQTGALGPWITSRLVPKVLLATQTNALEPLPDPLGVLLPSTPVLSVIPHVPADLWRLVALLASPVITAAAFEQSAGSALSANAVKLAAKQVLDLPLPGNADQWNVAASLIQRAHAAVHAPRHPDLLVQAAAAMNRAFGVGAPQSTTLLEWWRERAIHGP